MSKLRLMFEKKEAIRYLGHLDILRTFIRALRRAQIPVKYTSGYNPHATMSFALPIGVGVTSECEMVDIEMLQHPPIGKVINYINNNMPPNSVKIISGEYTDTKMPTITKAEYIIDIICRDEINAKLLEQALSQTEILVEKKSKKRVSKINIMEYIFESEIINIRKNVAKLRFIVSAGNLFNIKPQLITTALSFAAPKLNIFYALYHRKRFIFAEN